MNGHLTNKGRPRAREPVLNTVTPRGNTDQNQNDMFARARCHGRNEKDRPCRASETMWPDGPTCGAGGSAGWFDHAGELPGGGRGWAHVRAQHLFFQIHAPEKSVHTSTKGSRRTFMAALLTGNKTQSDKCLTTAARRSRRCCAPLRDIIQQYERTGCGPPHGTPAWPPGLASKPLGAGVW